MYIFCKTALSKKYTFSNEWHYLFDPFFKFCRLSIFYFSEQFFVLRAVKIPAGLLVLVNVSVRHTDFPHGDDLPIFVLRLRADTDIFISNSRNTSIDEGDISMNTTLTIQENEWSAD